MTTEEIQEIIESNYHQFKGSNEAILHASNEIADIFASEIEAKEAHYKEHIELLNHSHEQEIEEKDKLIFQQEWTLGDNEGVIKNLKNQIESKDKEIQEETARKEHFTKEFQKYKLLCAEKDKEIAELKERVATISNNCHDWMGKCTILHGEKRTQLSEIQSLKEEVERLKDSIFIVQGENLILHGCFSSKEKAENYINGSKSMRVQKIEIQ